MNTIKSTTKFRTLFGISVIVFMLSACSKDESMQPSSSSTDNAMKNALPYEMIKIDHMAGRSVLPDYQVTVYSDQRVVFEGRRNTAFIGKKTFTMDSESSVLKNLFESSGLFDRSVPSGVSANANDIIQADIPTVLTSYNNGSYTVTLKDYNDPYAKSNLYNVRVKAEDLLNISSLIVNKYEVFDGK
ncbi:MAG TPA: DUF6438 domain-containing protein [Bacteroidia bacterium]|nr:DUF6438 domain-containing protein [Bacteroidia bacterium]